jgi:ACS family sodium-dependent inorganic phosphate cotransporter
MLFWKITQGVAMPAMNNLLSRWIPVSERSRSLALVYSGMYLGSVMGLAFSPSLIHTFNWPSVFFSFGSLGIVWFLMWQRFVSFLVVSLHLSNNTIIVVDVNGGKF